MEVKSQWEELLEAQDAEPIPVPGPEPVWVRLEREREAGGTQLCKRCGRMRSLYHFFGTRKGEWRRACKDCLTLEQYDLWETEEEALQNAHQYRYDI